MKHREYFRSFKSRLKIFEKIQIFGGVEKDGQAVGVKWEQIATVWGQKIATVGGFSLWTRPGHWPYVFADWQLGPLLEIFRRNSKEVRFTQIVNILILREQHDIENGSISLKYCYQIT